MIFLYPINFNFLIRYHIPLLYGLYQLFGWLTFIVGLPFLLLYSVCTGRYREGLGQRLGFLGTGWETHDRITRIWLHGASVGEVMLAGLLIKELLQFCRRLTLSFQP